MTIICVRKSFSIYLLSMAQAHLLISQLHILHLFSRKNHIKYLQQLSCQCYCSFVPETPMDSFLNNISNRNNTLGSDIPSEPKQCTSPKSKSLFKNKFSRLETLNLTDKKSHSNPDYVPRKDSTIKKLLESDGPDACLEHLKLEDDISKYSFDSRSIKKLCHTASLTGSVALVRKLLKVAEINFAQTPRIYNGLHPYLALAEFNAGNYSTSLEVLSNIFQIGNLTPSQNGSHNRQKLFFKTIYSEVLRNATACIIAQIPEVGQTPDLDKADELVRLLEKLLNLPWPMFVLWQGYFFSASQNELVRADSLYKSKGVQKLALQNLCSIVEQLMNLHSVSQVQRFLELLLQHDQRSALPIITSLLLSMQCTEGNWRAAVEVLRFATSLKLRLSYNSMMRLQQLLHEHSVPLPQQLMELKYLEASHARKNMPPEYKF